MESELSEDETYCIEIRLDFTGTSEQVQAHANTAAQKVGGYVTAIFDENWDEVDV